jgi:hypothetical protein
MTSSAAHGYLATSEDRIAMRIGPSIKVQLKTAIALKIADFRRVVIASDHLP